MTREEMSRKFRQYRGLRLECERLRERLKEKRQEIYSVRVAVSDCAGIRSGDISDKVERAVELIDSLTHFYAEKIARMEGEEREIAEWISRISDSENRSILFMHYIECRTLEEIGEKLFLSERTVWNRRNAALDELCKLAG